MAQVELSCEGSVGVIALNRPAKRNAMSLPMQVELLDAAQTLLPAPLEADKIAEIQRIAVDAYQAAGCEGMARVDFLMEAATGTLYVNEINTIPGFTSISMYPKMWEAAGVPFSELLDRLIELALERHHAKAATKFER